jgi:hypothetical protein
VHTARSSHARRKGTGRRAHKRRIVRVRVRKHNHRRYAGIRHLSAALRRRNSTRHKSAIRHKASTRRTAAHTAKRRTPTNHSTRRKSKALKPAATRAISSSSYINMF